MVHHLTPQAHYYARIVTENAFGTAEARTGEFTTTPVGPPEITSEIKLVEPAAGSKSGSELGTTFAELHAEIETDGAETEYHFEYAPAESGRQPAEDSPAWVPFSSGATGTVTVAEDFADRQAKLTGLAPETTYCKRITVTNEKGTVRVWSPIMDGEVLNEKESCFTTPSARPSVAIQSVSNVAATSARLELNIIPRSSETHWRVEYVTQKHFEQEGFENAATGPEGIISAAEASEENVFVSVAFAGLSPATAYRIRLVAKNECPVICGTTTSEEREFKTAGPPSATTFAVHALRGETMRALGAVNTNTQSLSEVQAVTIGGSPSGGTFTLTFEGKTTADIPYDATPEAVHKALENLPGGPRTIVDGPAGGPYTVEFFRSRGVDVPQIEANASGLTPAGTVTVSILENGFSYDTHYHFQYVEQRVFEEHGGWSGAEETPEVDFGAEGNGVIGADLPGLQAGRTYRYRLLANNTTTGDPVVDGEDQTLTVPRPPAEEQPAACPNEAFRGGLSGDLPDCRAYEQVTPVEKGSSNEIFKYGSLFNGGAVVGADGDHVMFDAEFTDWDSGKGPYFFSRTPAGWLTTPGSPEPEAGLSKYETRLVDSDLTSFAFKSQWTDSSTAHSPKVEFKLGPPGGPYTTVASLPNQAEALGNEPGWVAASEDFSKLVLQFPGADVLTGHTGTLSGDDLYEYSEGVGLRQLNVSTNGVTIGSCGARVVDGQTEEAGGEASPHSVSADGSRVFFEAVPGSDCSEPRHLYMRVGGAETVDIGEYVFFAANAQGTKLLLKTRSGESLGFDTDTMTRTSPSSAELAASAELRSLEIPSSIDPAGALPTQRYTYFTGVVPALPVGERYLTRNSNKEIIEDIEGAGGPELRRYDSQLYRYDSVEKVIECVSCASPSDPEPKLEVENYGGSPGIPFQGNNNVPNITFASADGDYAFFSTPAALVPQDHNGELPFEGSNGEAERRGGSPSTDVYEWRKPGLDGCSQIQGCLSLITPGVDGYLVAVIGTAEEGRDVFFTTHSKLLPSDLDTSDNIWDARIDGGFPEPSHPVECEGDACSTPASAPNDATPSSLTFTGAGNIVPSATKPAAVKSKKPKPKKKTKKRKKTKKASKQRAKSNAKRAGETSRKEAR